MNQKQKEYLKEKIKPLYKWGEMPRRRYNDVVKDKAWAVLGDYVRIRDTVLYGECISCGRKVSSYHDFDPGHYHSMGAFTASLGFYEKNIHGQCKGCNAWGGMSVGAEYEKGLLKRYGQGLLDELELMKRDSVKADTWFYFNILEKVHGLFKQFKQKNPNIELPDYILGI